MAVRLPCVLTGALRHERLGSYRAQSAHFHRCCSHRDTFAQGRHWSCGKRRAAQVRQKSGSGYARSARLPARADRSGRPYADHFVRRRQQLKPDPWCGSMQRLQRSDESLVGSNSCPLQHWDFGSGGSCAVHFFDGVVEDPPRLPETLVATSERLFDRQYGPLRQAVHHLAHVVDLPLHLDWRCRSYLQPCPVLSTRALAHRPLPIENGPVSSPSPFVSQYRREPTIIAWSKACPSPSLEAQ